MAKYRSMKSFGRAWLKALRSGAYRQGRHLLLREGKAHDRFCCLGVAADLLVRDAPKRYSWTEDCAIFGKQTGGASDERLLQSAPKWMQGWLLDHECDLVAMNDGGRSFDYIADWIEERL